MQAIRDAIQEVLREDHPATVRSTFYRLVSAGVVPKTEQAYKNIVIRLLVDMRLKGEIPYHWIADHTRWRHGGSGFMSVGDWLKESLETYRLDLWRDQECYVEVWSEKDALTGVLLPVTDPLCVPLMVCRGYPSITYLASAAATIRSAGKPAVLYYLGDHDPSGVNIPTFVERSLRQFAPRAEIVFKRIAVTEMQIESLGLPTRPTKKSDSRAKNFVGESVEVDAIPPGDLRELVQRHIESHIDPVVLERLRREEDAGREALQAIRLPGWGEK